MNASNAKIAAVFEEIADLLAVEQVNPFRIRAYRNAARTLRAFAPEIAALLAAAPGCPAIERFVAIPEVAAVLAAGRSHASVRLRDGLQVDLHLLTPRSWDVGQARRDWLEAKDMPNSRPLAELRRWLRS